MNFSDALKTIYVTHSTISCADWSTLLKDKDALEKISRTDSVHIGMSSIHDDAINRLSWVGHNNFSGNKTKQKMNMLGRAQVQKQFIQRSTKQVIQYQWYLQSFWLHAEKRDTFTMHRHSTYTNGKDFLQIMFIAVGYWYKEASIGESL